MNDSLNRLLEIMARLRDPATGCPWDREQDFASIAPYTIEEAYEVADAIDRGDMQDLQEELGDLLLQVVFHAQMAREAGLFDFAAVATGIADKLVRRHPHVFGTVEAGSPEAQQRAWEQHKAEERAARKGPAVDRLLADITTNLPALTLTDKISRKAATVGFDWHTADQALAKVHEEIAELQEARAEGDQPHVEEEVGDLLLAAANLARKLGVDPEQALRAANRKFVERFNRLEDSIRADKADWSDFSLEELEARWQQIKR